MTFKTMHSLDLNKKRVLIREDLNVPIKEGLITSDGRLQAALPTLKAALEANAAVIVLSHLGRPQEGKVDSTYSLKPVADYLSSHLSAPVRFEKDYLNGVDVAPGELVLCENVRFNRGEQLNDDTLAKQYAALCDVFVMDAFGTAHREHASTCGISKHVKEAVAGPLLVRELEAIEHVLIEPKKPIVAVVGGAKISTKLELLKHMAERVDYLIPGGGIANTLLAADGHEIGLSLCESDLLEDAKAFLSYAEESNCQVLLPTDVVVGKACEAACPAHNKMLSQVAGDDRIFDIGPVTLAEYVEVLQEAQTIFWNGPVGVFELPQFAYGTRALAIAIAKSNAFSIAGGGDTLAAIDKFNLTKQISYVSTGGGAFLACFEGKTLPAVGAL